MDFGDRRAVKGGSNGEYSIFDFSSLGRNVEYFKFAVDTNKIDILPYVATDDKHPLIAKGAIKKKSNDYNLDIWVHRSVGPRKGNYVCLKRNYGLPCPICEASDAFKAMGKEEESKALWASRRLFYNVVNVLEPEKGVQILESNFKQFQLPLEAAQKSADTDEDIQEVSPNAFFADPDNGLTVKVLGTEKTFGPKQSKYVEPTNVSLVRRKTDVKEFLDKVVALDKYIKVKSYEELSAIYEGTETEETDEEDTVVETKEPTKETKVATKEVEEDSPPANKCPHGHEYHVDNDDFPECDGCKVWKDCVKNK